LKILLDLLPVVVFFVAFRLAKGRSAAGACLGRCGSGFGAGSRERGLRTSCR